jgi:uncharacterized membrane protein
MMSSPAAHDREESEIAGVLDRNIHAIIRTRREEEKHITWQDRVAQSITSFTGSIRFVVIHLVVFASWIVANSGPIPWMRFDPSFSVLAILISMESIFLSTFVLINQNRMVKINARQADLGLQVGLLAEHEITHLVQLVTAIADKMHLDKAKNPELNELQREVKPEQILEEIERRENRMNEEQAES